MVDTHLLLKGIKLLLALSFRQCSFSNYRTKSIQKLAAPLVTLCRSNNWRKNSILTPKIVYNIVYSQAVTHPSTNTTQWCLTSVIKRELVLSTWYGRRQQSLILSIDLANVVHSLCLLLISPLKFLPGALAGSCNPATWRQVLLDGLKGGPLVTIGSCRSGVRTKVCINMDLFGEPRRIRLTKTGRNGSGGKLSSQESLCGSVVG